jgi:ribonuclease PH
MEPKMFSVWSVRHEDSFQLDLEVVNAVTVNISDAARSTQTRQRIGISSGRRIQEVSR